MKQHDNHLLINLKEDQANYEKMAETGRILEEHVNNEDINPQSLRKEYIKALEVHHDQVQEDASAVLKPWQSKLLELMHPSARKIIWVRGTVGNEGKTWFQNYLENYYGRKRVYRSTINKKPESLLHTLSKRNLSFIDVFILNIPRSFDTSNVPYSFLEDIKDGKAISSKYNSRELKFITPNIVIVFSNDAPCVEQMSSDRWMRYNIRSGKLNVGFFSKKVDTPKKIRDSDFSD